MARADEARPRGRDLIRRVAQDFTRFAELEVGGAAVLLVATAVALVLANSGLGDGFEQFWHTEIGVRVGGFDAIGSLRHWIDDALMAVFFLVVGLEIKREFIVGELSAFRNAVLPVLAALGGMLFPALLYFAVTRGGDGAHGWGIPMATDIAFALGVLALLGRRIPAGLRVFLVALAIADDIGAVLVIALFYTSDLLWQWVGLALVLLALLAILNYLGVESTLPYVLVGTLVWAAFFRSGVHPTIAGVLVALTIPARAKTEPLEFVEAAKRTLAEIERLEVTGAHTLECDDQQIAARDIRGSALHVQAPLQRLELALHPVTTYLVLPAFALANAGIRLRGEGGLGLLLEPVGLGVLLGLVLGKQLGITLMAYLTVKLGLSDLPEGVGWGHVYGAAWLGGIGFTMSLFVSGLAFEDGAFVTEAKLAVLLASVIAGACGFSVLRFVSTRGRTSAKGLNECVSA